MPSDDVGAALSLRDRNKLRARAEIAEVALSLFRERGFEAVTVDDIVNAARVSKRTFFRYFGSKEDALLPDYPRLVGLLDEAMGHLEEESALPSARNALHRLADYYLERRAAVLTRSKVMRAADAPAARNLRLLSQWETLFAQAFAARLDASPSDLLPRTAAVLVVGAFRAALAQWVRSGARDDLHGLVDRAFDLVEQGLGGPCSGQRKDATGDEVSLDL